jgi:sugar (pentulose or hexulose) kinase
MHPTNVQKEIESGKACLGIEFGSTRIKAVLIGTDHTPIASGSHEWENRYENGIWTYHLDDVWTGLQESYRNLTNEVFAKYNTHLKVIGAIGFSAMMHGYVALGKEGELLVPFRTWRNTITGEAAEKLTELFQFNIPQRWSIAHLYQAILNKEPHIQNICHLTTLAGYVHWKLTGQRVLGVGEASGMFPIVKGTNGYCYDEHMLELFNKCTKGEKLAWKLQDILPKVLVAGEAAGFLTEEGAKLIDPTGQLQAGIPLCPPEGDAGTGMVATNSVAQRTGNVSAGTSVFAMIVLEKALSKVYPEIDLVTTPAGKLVAMVHSNNCTSDLNAWVELFHEFTQVLGVDVNQSKLFETLYQQALGGDADGGGLLSYNYLSGEHITHLEEGRPMFIRTPTSRFTLANFMRTHLFASLGALRIGLDILFDKEQVKIDQILGHGGFFKTPEVGQKMMAAAMNVPVSVMATAGEGGAWGIALLASYMVNKATDEPLEAYLSSKVFAGENGTTIIPDQKDVDGFTAFMERYKKGLVIERAAVDGLK